MAFSYGSYAAHVVEAGVAGDGTTRVHRVVCAIDCGIAVNPDLVKAQMEGGAVYVLTGRRIRALRIRAEDLTQA